MFIVDDGKGGLRALATGDEIYFRDAVGGLRADTAYYAIVGADGSIRLAATLADAMLYQTGAGQNDALLALYPGMGKAVTVDFKATDLASAQAYVRNYVQKTDAPAQTADEIALYGSSYRTGYFFYFRRRRCAISRTTCCIRCPPPSTKRSSISTASPKACRRRIAS